MKKGLMLIFCFVFCIVLSSCAHIGTVEQFDTEKTDTLDETEQYKTQIMSEHNDESDEIPTETYEDNNNFAETTNQSSMNEHEDPPHTISFYSLDEIYEFVEAMKGTKDNYDQYMRESPNKNRMITYEMAMACYKSLLTCELPIINDDSKMYSVVMEYIVEQNILSIACADNGVVKYRFAYHFKYMGAHTNDSFPVIEGMKMGDREVDIYQNDFSFYTTYLQGTTMVFVNIFVDNVSDVSFDCFDIEPLVSK